MTTAPVAGPPAERFPMRLEPRWRIPLLIWGARPSNAYIDLDDQRMDAHFGFGSLMTEVSNIESYAYSGPWNWLTAIGIRRGVLSGDASFCGNNQEGVRIQFKHWVQWGALFRPHALFVTPADREAFGRALEARGIRRTGPGSA
jgi:hypothetical protein